MKRKITLLTLALFIIPFSSYSTTLYVNNTNNSGPNSLRDAISTANSTDTIRFNPNLIAGGNATITLTSEIAWTNKGLTLIGLYNSTDTLYISGDNTNRIFNVNLASAIAGEKYLTLDSLVVINSFTTGEGGALVCYNINDTLTINNSIFDNNTSNGGGAISIRDNSPTNIASSTFSNNSAVLNNGGAIFLWGYSQLTINKSTFNGNYADNGGGAIYAGDHAPIIINTTTIYNNEAPLGAITTYVECDLIATSSTIYNNTSHGFRIENQCDLSLISSIIFGNTLGNVSLNNGGQVIESGYNIFDDNPSLPSTSDQVNVTPMQLNLGAFQNNGGNTKTLLPGIGSIAINTGAPLLIGDAQNRAIVGIRDIGAAENCTNSSIQTEIHCGSFLWIDGNTYTTSNNTASYTLTNNSGCDSIVTLDLTINPSVDINTTTSGATLTANTSGATYQWLDCDNNNVPITGATNQDFTATTNGNYAVEITENGCTDTSACMSITSVGINNYASVEMSIYPNPTNNQTTLSYPVNESVFVQIHAVDGKLVDEFQMYNNITLTLPEEKGVYIISLQHNKQIKNLKVIKQ